MNKKRIFRDYLCLILLIMALIFSNVIIKSKNSEEKVMNKISSSLTTIQNEHDSLSSYFKNNPQNIIDESEKLYPIKNSKLAIYIFKNDSLAYWNSDINDPSTLLKKCIYEKNIFTQGNYDFFVTRTNTDSLSFLTSTPLYYKNPDSSQNNIYLPKKIHGSYSINFAINENDIDYKIQYKAKMNDLDSYLIGILAIIILIKFFSFIYKLLQNYRPERNNYLPFLILSSAVYATFILLQKKLFLNTSDLFGASCLLPNCKYSFSLGNLAEFSILLFSNIIILASNLKKETTLRKSIKILASCSLFIFIILI